MRNLMVIALSLAVATSSFAAYTSRLWFSNVTTGADGAGAIAVRPGDEVWLSYSFHKTDSQKPSKWFTLEAALDLQGKTLLSDSDANTWSAQVRAAFFRELGPYPYTWQPSDGAMYDNIVNPGDTSQPLVTPRGTSALIMPPLTANEMNEDAPGFFRFHVTSDAVPGEALKWLYPGRNTDSGIATQILDDSASYVDATDNWVVVVPEPGTIAVAGVGLLALMLRRRR